LNFYNENFIFYRHDLTRENNLMNRHLNARSDESLSSSGDMTSSTVQNYHSLPGQVYYADESDEGLVKLLFCFYDSLLKKLLYL